VSRPSATPLAVAVVAAGGAGGAVLRWFLGEVFPDGVGFPWTTLGINVVGSFVLACMPAFDLVRRRVLVALALGPGVLGGFTTLSTYADQSRGLLADGRPWLAAAYLLGTLAACLVAVSVGHRWSTVSQQRAFDAEQGNE
jgi:fluoride exporter